MKIHLPTNLQTRVVVPVIIGLVLLVAGVTQVGFVTVQESTDRTLQERLVIAQVSADRVDDLLERTIQLADWLVDEREFDPGYPPSDTNREAMRYLYDHLDGMAYFVGLIDRQGVKVWTEPYREHIVGMDFSGPAFERLADLRAVESKIEDGPGAAIPAGPLAVSFGYLDGERCV